MFRILAEFRTLEAVFFTRAPIDDHGEGEDESADESAEDDMIGVSGCLWSRLHDGCFDGLKPEAGASMKLFAVMQHTVRVRESAAQGTRRLLHR